MRGRERRSSSHNGPKLLLGQVSIDDRANEGRLGNNPPKFLTPGCEGGKGTSTLISIYNVAKRNRSRERMSFRPKHWDGDTGLRDIDVTKYGS